MVVGGRLETGSDGTVGKSGAEPRCGGVLGVFGCDALLEHRRRQKRGVVS